MGRALMLEAVSAMNLIVAVISASVEIFLVLGGLHRKPRSTQYDGAILVVIV